MDGRMLYYDSEHEAMSFINQCSMYVYHYLSI